MDKINMELIMAAFVLLLVINNLLKPVKDTFDYVMIVVGVALIIRQLYMYFQSKKS